METKGGALGRGHDDPDAVGWPGLVLRDGTQRLTVRTLDPAEAVKLLEHVTVRHRPQDDPQEVAELARLCGQLPLALRIAAERVAIRPHMPLADLIQDLRDESSLWDALATDDEEAGTVRSVFAWSYRVLPEGAARLFRLLGLHPGRDFTAGAAAALGTCPPVGPGVPWTLWWAPTFWSRPDRTATGSTT